MSTESKPKSVKRWTLGADGLMHEVSRGGFIASCDYDALQSREQELERERDSYRKDAERYRGLRAMSTYRYDGGQYVLDFDNWISVPGADVDEFNGDGPWPTPPDQFDGAIDAALAQHAKQVRT